MEGVTTRVACLDARGLNRIGRVASELRVSRRGFPSSRCAANASRTSTEDLPRGCDGMTRRLPSYGAPQIGRAACDAGPDRRSARLKTDLTGVYRKSSKRAVHRAPRWRLLGGREPFPCLSDEMTPDHHAITRSLAHAALSRHGFPDTAVHHSPDGRIISDLICTERRAFSTSSRSRREIAEGSLLEDTSCSDQIGNLNSNQMLSDEYVSSNALDR